MHSKVYMEIKESSKANKVHMTTTYENVKP